MSPASITRAIRAMPKASISEVWRSGTNRVQDPREPRRQLPRGGSTLMPTVRLSRFFALAGVLAMLASATLAHADPRQPAVGPFIEDSSYYEGQTKCSPNAKPGVVSFQRMVLAAYPGTGA